MNTLTHPKWQTLAESAAPRHGWVWYLSWGTLLALLAASWNGADMRPLDLWRDSGNMPSTRRSSFRPTLVTGACT